MIIALDKHKKPVGFITERRCRKLLEAKRAVFYRMYPAIVIIKDKDVKDMQELPTFRIKIDPGAKYTGLAVVCNETDEVMFFARIEHRGEQVKSNMDTRREARRNRRSRETRYRRNKFKKGGEFTSGHKKKLTPSVKSVADNVINWVRKLSRFIHITKCSFEAVRFDTQLMDNPDIKGVEYQQGTLFGYELREYLMEHFRHTCQYCGGASKDDILEWEHMVPRSRGGSDSVKNASLACKSCNSDKGSRTLPEYLEYLKSLNPKTPKEKELINARISHISGILESKTVYGSDRYSAWANSTRKYIENHLLTIFPDLECASGGRTKYNRIRLGYLQKDHHIDALCVGTVPDDGYKDRTKGYCLFIKAMGRGTRLRGQLNSCGIIILKYKDNTKRVDGFQTGDMITADIPKGKYKGKYTGRVSVRKKGAFDIRTKDARFSVNRKYCKVLQRDDGYSYFYSCPIPLGN